MITAHTRDGLGTHTNAAVSNPFSTRFISPVVMAYCFSESVSAGQLVNRLKANRWNGQIVGPHGSGKSTLINALVPVLVDQGRDVVCYELRDGQRRWLPAWAERQNWNHSTLVVVDGYEQLGAWYRWRLQRLCRRIGCGLLITTHRRQHCPVLCETTTSETLLKELVERLTAGIAAETRPTAVQIGHAFTRHSGNLREALLSLYDVFEQRRRAEAKYTMSVTKPVDWRPKFRQRSVYSFQPTQCVKHPSEGDELE